LRANAQAAGLELRVEETGAGSVRVIASVPGSK
jgi:hypothetical protein